MPVKGKVAKILNSREIVINKGADDGVKTGMRFDIQEQEIIITDPDSKENLGRLIHPKISVQIMDVEPRFSIARTFETFRVPNPEARHFPTATSYIPRSKKFRTEDSSDFREDSVYVSVGDTVVEIPG